MSGKTWVCADHHFGHKNILTFKDENDKLIRGSRFKDPEEHDNLIVKYHNERVGPGDRVYMLGDVIISRRAISTLGRLQGRLVLVKGNHDIFNLKDYLPYFDDIRSYVVQKDGDGNKVILSHIPIHPESLGRWGRNIHGHLHQNKVLTSQGRVDPSYVCVSLEHTDYAPIQIHEALKRCGQ
jgi:calcineurin-like phosphoesterase family protein